MSKELTPATQEQELTANLFVVELEERLEMVQGGADQELAADIVISCCLD